MDVTVAGFRVLREVAERGSFTAAAESLGYTQSAVSRQIAALEAALGARLFERRRTGVRLTPAGREVLRHGATALDAIDAARRAARGPAAPGGLVRLGAFASAGAVLVPRAIGALGRDRPEIELRTREGSTPALVRALRAGTLDLAVLASAPPFRAPDGESPRLVLEAVSEAELLLAVPAAHPFAAGTSVDVDQLAGQRWIASPSPVGETRLGVWPGLAGRARVAHTSRDWLAKLQLVAAGAGITTIPRSLGAVVPEGVSVLRVRGGPRETRRIVLARRPGPPIAAVRAVADAIHAAAASIHEL